MAFSLKKLRFDQSSKRHLCLQSLFGNPPQLQSKWRRNHLITARMVQRLWRTSQIGVYWWPRWWQRRSEGCRSHRCPENQPRCEEAITRRIRDRGLYEENQTQFTLPQINFLSSQLLQEARCVKTCQFRLDQCCERNRAQPVKEKNSCHTALDSAIETV